jgi:hypothetical protein
VFGGDHDGAGGYTACHGMVRPRIWSGVPRGLWPWLWRARLRVPGAWIWWLRVTRSRVRWLRVPRARAWRMQLHELHKLVHPHNQLVHQLQFRRNRWLRLVGKAKGRPDFRARFIYKGSFLEAMYSISLKMALAVSMEPAPLPITKMSPASFVWKRAAFKVP